MLTRRIIPCLDVYKGRVVKGVRFQQLRDAGDPAAMAAWYEKEGADEIVFLDISASRENRNTILEVVKNTAETIFIPFTVGGGIASIELIQELLQAGADKVSLNTSAVQDPELIARASDYFGSQCIVAAIDAKKVDTETFCWEVYTHGGTVAAGLDVIKWAAEAARLGAGEILLTSVDADGTREGYDLELIRRVSDAVPVPVIASGGAGSLEHLRQVLVQGKADAVLAASIFHYELYTVKAVKDFLAGCGIAVRPLDRT